MRLPQENIFTVAWLGLLVFIEKNLRYFKVARGEDIEPGLNKVLAKTE
jgi:hypothetical protein